MDQTMSVDNKAINRSQFTIKLRLLLWRSIISNSICYSIQVLDTSKKGNFYPERAIHNP